MEKLKVGNTRIKEYVKVDARESEKIYKNKRLCNKKKKRRRKKRQNSHARKEDLEFPMESTSSPDADFIGLATRTPTRSTLGIQVLGRRSKGREWETN